MVTQMCEAKDSDESGAGEMGRRAGVLRLPSSLYRSHRVRPRTPGFQAFVSGEGRNIM